MLAYVFEIMAITSKPPFLVVCWGYQTKHHRLEDLNNRNFFLNSGD
jgi:hypothetical protein